MRVAAIIVWSAVAILLSLLPAAAEKRVALVIGNGTYKNAPQLPNPKNDAEDIAAALTRTGFETILGLDLDKAGMEDATIRFARSAREADVAIFYYSGHAMQFAGVNYLMPVDAKLTDEADLRRMARVDDIVTDVQQAKNLRIVVLDSCRDNPLAEELKRSIGRTRGAAVQRGLAKIDSPQGMIIAYSTQAGRTADDGKGRNSPYTTAFLRHIETPEEIGTIFRNVSEDVYQTTQRAQLPELSLSIIGKFYLKGQLNITVAPPVSSGPSEAERAWSLAKDTTSPSVLEDFIRRFGDSFYATLAREKLEALKKSQVAVVAPLVAPVQPPTPVQPAVGIFLTSRAAIPLTPAEERALKPKDNFKECDACPGMIVVPTGSFTMGSSVREPDRRDDEGPQHQVTFARQFAVGRFAVTFDEWDACVADGDCNGYRPWDQGWGRGQRPVISVSWNDAKAYVVWLSRRTGKTYRLLSESEREYVTRAGTTTPFWWGSSISTLQANYDGNYTYASGSKGEYRKRTMPVDSFQANPWGLYHVHGNVWDWTVDCYKNSYAGAPNDGSASISGDSGDCGRRVVRGGSWFNFPQFLRSTARHWITTGDRINYVGFRVGRTLTP